MGGRRLGGRALPGSRGGRCRAVTDESDMATGRGRMFCETQRKCRDEVLTRVGGWCRGRDWRQVHLRNVKVVTVVRILGCAHTAEITAECL